MSTTTDGDLVHSALAGDAAALGGLLERYRASLYASALAVLGDRAAALDAVQDTFLVALQRIGDVREPAAVGGWLHAVVRNVCLMRIRSSREIPFGVLPEHGTTGSDAEESLDRLALRDWVWTALEDLSEDVRVTVMLRYFTRRTSYAEIASILGVPVGTVRSRLNHGKRKLADSLLEAAAAEHHDHAALVRQRWREWTDAVDQIEAEGVAEHFLARCAPDAILEAPSLGWRSIGPDEYRRDVIESVTAGVRLHMTDIVASENVTILDGVYRNPPNDPHHCPPTHTEVRLHAAGRISRLVLYYGAEHAAGEPRTNTYADSELGS